jgi:hypothetical protein
MHVEFKSVFLELCDCNGQTGIFFLWQTLEIQLRIYLVTCDIVMKQLDYCADRLL